jgi:hypothetical protein
VRTPIHSKWHHIRDLKKIEIALQVAECKTLPNTHNAAAFIHHDTLENIFDVVDKFPKYVMYDDIVRLIYTAEENAIHQSVNTMVGANLAHLPFPDILVEFTAEKYISGKMITQENIEERMKVRQFVWLSENNKSNVLAMSDSHPFAALNWILVEKKNASPFVILNPNLVFGKYIQDGAHDGTNKLGLDYKHHYAPFLNIKALGQKAAEDLRQANLDETMWTTSCALTAAIALLRTKGVVQDKIEAPAKLNKSRIASGKAPIRDHTVIRIGHTYDRAGNAVAYNSSGRTMPVHWRAGHIRNQRFGPGLSKSYQVFIEPMLINYTEDDKVPVPVKEVTL